jgi:hypothetical protein
MDNTFSSIVNNYCTAIKNGETPQALQIELELAQKHIYRTAGNVLWPNLSSLNPLFYNILPPVFSKTQAIFGMVAVQFFVEADMAKDIIAVAHIQAGQTTIGNGEV